MTKMSPETAASVIWPAAMQFLPAHMDSDEALAMYLAICLQESDFKHRSQLVGGHRRWWEVVKPPARGYPQFEHIGVKGVMEHPASRSHASRVVSSLGYPVDPGVVHKALTHNDILGAVLVRLALRRLPKALSERFDVDEGYRQYVEVWRPGHPRPERWQERFSLAWHVTHDLRGGS